MARELRRLLIPPQRLAQTATQHDPKSPGTLLRLAEPERHYLLRVLRQRDGDRVEVVDGQGGLWTAQLEEGSRLRLDPPLAAPLRCELPPSPPLELALALPRRDVELVWRMATELGIDRFRPLLASRCVVQGRPPLERWRSVISEACEQCERLWRPQLLDPADALPWLAEAQGVACFIGTTRDGALPSLASVLAELQPQSGATSVAIGPEGGWCPEEEAAAIASGWRPVSLGPLILRSGTAAVAAAVQLAAWRQGMEPLSQILRT